MESGSRHAVAAGGIAGCCCRAASSPPSPTGLPAAARSDGPLGAARVPAAGSLGRVRLVYEAASVELADHAAVVEVLCGIALQPRVGKQLHDQLDAIDA